MTTGACVLPHRHEPERLRSTVAGMLVCHGCLGNLEQAVAEMPAHYSGLARRLAPAPGHGPMVSGSRERALPIDPTVADHRSDLRGKLASWSSMVAEEREISGPRSGEVEATAPWLLVHLRWCCAQPWVDEYGSELRSLRSRSLSLLYPSGRRRVTVGGCIEPGCDGVLTATLAPSDDLEFPCSIDCSHNGDHKYGSADWVKLGRRVFAAEVGGVSA